MNLSRRAFVGSPGAVAACRRIGETPLLKLALCTDPHIKDAETAENMRKVFEYARRNDVDGVLIAGDITSDGREGRSRNGENERQIVVSFPPAKPSDSVPDRVCDYKVCAMRPDGTEIVTQHVLAENYFAPCRKILGRVECVFGRSSIPEGMKPVWSVTPYGFGGNPGNVLKSR